MPNQGYLSMNKFDIRIKLNTVILILIIQAHTKSTQKRKEIVKVLLKELEIVDPMEIPLTGALVPLNNMVCLPTYCLWQNNHELCYTHVFWEYSSWFMQIADRVCWNTAEYLSEF